MMSTVTTMTVASAFIPFKTLTNSHFVAAIPILGVERCVHLQVMSLGLSVEFCLHVAVAFQNVPGTRCAFV